MEKENNIHTHTVQHCHIENDEQFAGLTVNVGVKQPPSVNPYMKPRVRRTMPAVGEIVEGILRGDVTMLSRAVTLVESVSPQHQSLAQEVIEKCLPYSAYSHGIRVADVRVSGKS